jgi:hypothetical protein
MILILNDGGNATVSEQKKQRVQSEERKSPGLDSKNTPALVESTQPDAPKAAPMKVRNEHAAEAKPATTEANATGLFESIKIGGTIEVEATQVESFTGTESSDITLAKVELYFDTEPHEFLKTHVQLLYEDDGNENITLDEAYATLGNTEKFPVYFQAGKWAVPFGNFDTDMGTDPLTKSLGETNEAAVLVGATWNGFAFEAYAYNGDTRKELSSNKIDQGGLAFGYSGKFKDVALDIGVGYILNIADSNGLTTALGDNATALNRYVAGFESHAGVIYNNITLRGGYMTAISKFQSSDLEYKGKGAKPKLWNLEAAYAANIFDKDVTLAATAQRTYRAFRAGLPESRYGGAVTVGIFEHADISLEYLRDYDYGTGSGGTGTVAHTGTLKLAVNY